MLTGVQRYLPKATVPEQIRLACNTNTSDKRSHRVIFSVILPNALACPAYWPALLGCFGISPDLNISSKSAILPESPFLHTFLVTANVPLPLLRSPPWSHHWFLLLPQESELMSHQVLITLPPHCSSPHLAQPHLCPVGCCHGFSPGLCSNSLF